MYKSHTEHTLDTYTHMLFMDRSRLTGARVVLHEDYANWIASEFMSRLFLHRRLPSKELQSFVNKYKPVLAQHLQTLMDAHDRIICPRPSTSANLEFVNKMAFDPKDCIRLVEPCSLNTYEYDDFHSRSEYEREYSNYFENLRFTRALSLNRVLNIVIGSAILAERENPVSVIDSTNVLIQMVKTSLRPGSHDEARDLLFQIQSVAEFLVKSRIADITTDMHAELTSDLAVLYPSVPFLKEDVQGVLGIHRGLVIHLYGYTTDQSSCTHEKSWSTESKIIEPDKLPADNLSFATLLAMLNEDSVKNVKSNKMSLFTFVGALYDDKSPMMYDIYKLYATQLAKAAENYPYPVASDIAKLKNAVGSAFAQLEAHKHWKY